MCWSSSTFSWGMFISVANSSGVGWPTLQSGVATQVHKQLPRHAAQRGDHLDHVHRDSDGAGLISHRAGNGLADLPGCVGGELVTLGVVELLHLTDQVAAAGVALGHRHDQPQLASSRWFVAQCPPRTIQRRSRRSCGESLSVTSSALRTRSAA
jgi:hypothetical protein